MVRQWCCTGQFPSCFQVFAMARVQGEQTINRAETMALIVAADLGPHIQVHTDSTYAISMVTRAFSDAAPSPNKDSNMDLLERFRHSNLRPEKVRKVKAHQQPSLADPWWNIFTALGNQAADQAAGQALVQLQPDWHAELVKRHEEVQTLRQLFHGTCEMVLALNKSRTKAVQQLQLEENNQLPGEQMLSSQRIQQLLSDRSPDACQVLATPDLSQWNKFCAWGQHIPPLFFQWLQLVRWPVEPGGPLHRETGISWVELGLSFSMHIKRLLPILRKDHQGQTQLLDVQDRADAFHYNVTFKDIATSFENIWNQLRLWEASAFPTTTRGQTTSLQSQGFLQHTTGLGMRPSMPCQGRVVEMIRLLAGKRQFNVTLDPDWCEDRLGDLAASCWKSRCDLFRDARRRASRTTVSL